MVKIKEEKKIPTAIELIRMRELEAEADHLLDLLFEHPDDRKLIERLNWIDKAYVALSGDTPLDIGEYFKQ